MKKSFLLAACTALMLSAMVSCKKDAPAPTNDPKNISKCYTRPPSCNPTPPPTADCGAPTVVDLKTGQGTTVGSVTVSNDQNYLKVKYTTTGSYKLDDLHLYVGNANQVPTRYGSVNLSQFPYSKDITNSTTTTYTFTIPMSALGSCFSVFAEASVRSSGSGWGCYGGSGSTDAWGRGTRYTSNSCGSNSSAYYFSYCKATCTRDTCLTPAAVLFNGESGWPYGATSVTVGGYTYTSSQVATQYYSADNDAKAALLLIATLKIYGSNITVPTNIATDAATVENWLATLGQLTSTSSFTAPANVQTAIANVQAWEASKVCAP